MAFLAALLPLLVTQTAAAQRLAWRKVSPATSPPATYGHAMAYDPVRQRVVLFGGVGGPTCCATPNADVWEWDGQTWAKITASAGGGAPPGRLFGALAYAPGPQRVLAFGGLDAGSVANDQTWLWDGAAWAEVAKPAPPAVVPPARFRAAAITASDALGVLLFPGATAAGLPESGAIFQFDTAWKKRAETPPPLVDFGAAYSPSDQRGYTFSGRPCSVPDDTCKPTSAIYQWKEGEATWSAVPGVGVPRWGATLAFHGTSGVVAMGGGADAAGGAIPDGYALAFQNPGGFTQTFSGGISPRVHHAAAWDEARKQIVVFGGVTLSAPPFAVTPDAMLADTWVLDAIGNTCGSDGACSTGHCVDGVCCTEGACGNCAACNRPLYAGLCSPVVNAKDEDTCATACDAAGKCVVGKRPLGLACDVAGDCLSGQCVDGVCCDQPACGVCEACGLAGSEGSCAAVAGPDPDSCPNGCDFAKKKKQCLKGAGEPCGAPLECASGQCIAGLCGGKTVGDDCASAGQCKSGACVDGVCCETKSCGACQTCGGTTADPNARGACTKILNGPDPDSCPDTCDAAGVCAKKVLAEAGATCAQGEACTSGICWRETPAAALGVCCPESCAGACSVCDTTCHARPKGSAPRAGAGCAAEACDGLLPGCPASCDPVLSPCGGGLRCVGNVCVPPRPNGASCATEVECASNACAPGETGGERICCDNACDAPCATCDGGACHPIAAGSTPHAGACDGKACDGQNAGCPDPNACPLAGCPVGTRCAVGKGCVVPRPIGGACTNRDECADTKTSQCLSGRCCDAATDPTCGLRCNEDGSAVLDTLKSTSTPCAEGSRCRGGYCVASTEKGCNGGAGCVPGQTCEPDGTCSGAPRAARQWDLATPIGCSITCGSSPPPIDLGACALVGFFAGLARRRRPRRRVGSGSDR